MDGVLPFEYGVLYRTIPNPGIDAQEEIKKGIQLDNQGTFYQNYGGISGYVTQQGIDHTKYFHPIGYISTLQKVIAECVVFEEEKTSGHLQMSGMSFTQNEVRKTYQKIYRVHIDVNVFIKNFEKVL